MVARTPPKQQRRMVVVAPHLSPTLLRETVKKVDKCMARLQELQYTVTGGIKVSFGANLSPRSSRSYSWRSLCCKQEYLRIRNANNSRRSPPGKLSAASAEDWRRMSLPAMLLGETMEEVLQATEFARNIVQAMSSKTKKSATTDDPKTPMTQDRNPKIASVENPGLMQARRRREKRVVLQRESDMPPLTRAKSKINFKPNKECDKENCMYTANRFSPRNMPLARKIVLLPNPSFLSSLPTSQHQKFVKTKSPTIVRNVQTPHKFLTTSPPPNPSKFQVRIRSPPISILPANKSPKASTAAKMRMSFSPSMLANRIVSPLKSRKKSSIQKNQEMMFAEIARSRQTAYKFLIKSPPQGKIKSSHVSTSPTQTTNLVKKSSPKLIRSFSPSRVVVSPIKFRKSIQKNLHEWTQ